MTQEPLVRKYLHFESERNRERERENEREKNCAITHKPMQKPQQYQRSTTYNNNNKKLAF